jgi:hypothetical protein
MDAYVNGNTSYTSLCIDVKLVLMNIILTFVFFKPIAICSRYKRNLNFGTVVRTDLNVTVTVRSLREKFNVLSQFQLMGVGAVIPP